jgi:drug/metabolite transporter (DMT)-like permease
MRVMPVGLLGFLGALATTYLTSAATPRGTAMPQSAIIFFSVIPVILLIAYFFLRRKLEELKALPQQR